jgi:hypothetical protein
MGIVTHLPGGVDEHGNEVHAGKYMRIVGYRNDTQMVRALYRALGYDMIEALTTEMADERVKKVTRRKDDREAYEAEFCDGFASRVDDRLGEIEARITQMAREHASGSLLPALRSRLQQVQDKVTDMYGQLGAVEMRRFDYNAHARRRGAAAADNSDLGQTKFGGRGKGLPEGTKGLPR